jgi:hypothetical protein
MLNMVDGAHLVASAGVMRGASSARRALVPRACSAKPSHAPPAKPSVRDIISRDNGCIRWLSAAPPPAALKACNTRNFEATAAD